MENKLSEQKFKWEIPHETHSNKFFSQSTLQVRKSWNLIQSINFVCKGLIYSLKNNLHSTMQYDLLLWLLVRIYSFNAKL